MDGGCPENVNILADELLDQTGASRPTLLDGRRDIEKGSGVSD